MLHISPSNIVTRFAFAPGDTLIANGFEWIVFERRNDRIVVTPKNGQGFAQEFSDTELAQLAKENLLGHQRAAISEPDFMESSENVVEFLTSLSAEQRERVEQRRAAVLAFHNLYDAGEIKKTYESIEKNQEKIQIAAGKILREAGEKSLTCPDFVPKTILRWIKNYKLHGIGGLCDAAHFRGNTSARLRPEVSSILHRCVQGYMDRNKPTKQTIFENVRREVARLNTDRLTAGLPELKAPSRQTVSTAIAALDDFEVCLAREGAETARRKFAPVSGGVGALRPLQRVEIDEWYVDLIKLLNEGDFFSAITKEERAALGLDRKTLRVLVTVAVCTATRCIVGLCISPQGSTDSALQAIEMITRDKGVYADAVGALSPWHMYGTPELIVTDCATYNISAAARHAVDAIGGRIEHCPAGHPQMKGIIERLFRTISTHLLPRLTGRTFHDVVTKGDRDPAADAALSVNDFCNVLTRWIVDIYHRKEHQGLSRETPLDCWDRLVKKFGVRPAPDRKRRTLAFGKEEERRLLPTGITLMGIRYHDNVLASLMMRNEKAVLKFRWHPADLGAIFVEIEGKWHEVRNVGGHVDGVSALHWDLTRRALQTKHKDQAELQAEIVHKALDEIERINRSAMTRAGVQVEKWTDEKIARIEEELSIGFNITSDPASEATSDDGFGVELPTALSVPEPSEPVETTEPPQSLDISPEPAETEPTTPACSSRRRKAADNWTFKEK